MSNRGHSEQLLLADVVHDDTYAAWRDAVQGRCVEEMRGRRAAERDLFKAVVGETAAAEASRPPDGSIVKEPGGRAASTAVQMDQSYPAFLESVRTRSASALRRRRVLPMWFRTAAAAAVVMLVGASFLLRSPDEQLTLAADETPAPVPERPSYIVVSRLVPPGVIVRTADRSSAIEYIGDDELLEAVPGLAIARIGLPDGGRKVIVHVPGMERVLRLN